MNDSLRTNVFVRFQAETIACACIFLAARALQVRGNVNLKHLFHFATSLLFIGLVLTSNHLWLYSIAPSNVITFLCMFFPDTSAIQTSLVPAVWSQ